MNFIFISPNFPHTYWQFCNRLKRNGINILGIGDAPYDTLEYNLKSSLNEYYKVSSLENYNEVYDAVKFFENKYGKIDFIESNNEYWLEQDSKLRFEFNITSGIQFNEIKNWKQKSLMKNIYKKANIPTAEQDFITTKENAIKFINDYNYPVIIKPDIGVGSSDTWKIENEDELNLFFQNKSEYNYVIEQFIEGDVCSYDAIVNSNSEPVFESMTVWPPSIADIVNKGYDLSYFVAPDMPDSLKILGRKTIKAFNVKNRFVHLEFFKLKKDYINIGKIGDFAALEVNMRPAGGYTPDMINFAHSIDTYQIWADVLTNNYKTNYKNNENYYCVYASRKNGHKYLHTHDEIMNRYYGNIVMCEKMPELMWDTMGCQMYTAKFKCKEEKDEFINFIQHKGG